MSCACKLVLKIITGKPDKAMALAIVKEKLVFPNKGLDANTKRPPCFNPFVNLSNSTKLVCIPRNCCSSELYSRSRFSTYAVSASWMVCARSIDNRRCFYSRTFKILNLIPEAISFHAKSLSSHIETGFASFGRPWILSKGKPWNSTGRIKIGMT